MLSDNSYKVCQLPITTIAFCGITVGSATKIVEADMIGGLVLFGTGVLRLKMDVMILPLTGSSLAMPIIRLRSWRFAMASTVPAGRQAADALE